jgi:hypothetical protein
MRVYKTAATCRRFKPDRDVIPNRSHQTPHKDSEDTHCAMLPTELWLDGGHNPAGGLVVAQAMAGRHERDPRPFILISGGLASKDTGGFLQAFAGLAQEVLTVPIPGEHASRSADDVAAIARTQGLPATAGSSVSNPAYSVSSSGARSIACTNAPTASPFRPCAYNANPSSRHNSASPAYAFTAARSTPSASFSRRPSNKPCAVSPIRRPNLARPRVTIADPGAQRPACSIAATTIFGDMVLVSIIHEAMHTIHGARVSFCSRAFLC